MTEYTRSVQTEGGPGTYLLKPMDSLENYRMTNPTPDMGNVIHTQTNKSSISQINTNLGINGDPAISKWVWFRVDGHGWRNMST